MLVCNKFSIVQIFSDEHLQEKKPKLNFKQSREKLLNRELEHLQFEHNLRVRFMKEKHEWDKKNQQMKEERHNLKMELLRRKVENAKKL